MSKLTPILLICVVVSGLYLVRISHEARTLFADIERAKAEEQQLQADERRLEAERRTAATHLRVEKVAREKLSMKLATAENTLYVAGRQLDAHDALSVPDRLGLRASSALAASASGVAP